MLLTQQICFIKDAAIIQFVYIFLPADKNRT